SIVACSVVAWIAVMDYVRFFQVVLRPAHSSPLHRASVGNPGRRGLLDSSDLHSFRFFFGLAPLALVSVDASDKRAWRVQRRQNGCDQSDRCYPATLEVT